MKWENRKMKIIIVDSGCIYEQSNKNNVKGFSVVKKDSNYTIEDDFEDKVGHGTAILNIFLKFIPNEKYVICKIFEEENIPEDKLIFALEYICNNVAEEGDVINISSGVKTSTNKAMLERICNKLVSKKVMIVSAFDNMGAISFPAAFSRVIGVDYIFGSNIRIKYEFLEESIVNVVGSITKQRLMWNDGSKKIVQGNSFIAPYITMLVYKHIKETGAKDFDEIIEYLKIKSSSQYRYDVIKNDNIFELDRIKNAIAFPFNKEIHSIVRFEDSLKFHVKSYYDIRQSGKVGKCIREFVKNHLTEKKICNINTLDWDTEFDTVILGHTNKIDSATGTNHKKIIIEKCLEHKKNLYMFETIEGIEKYRKKFKQENLMLYCSTTHKYDDWENKRGKLYSYSTPIVGILGTSSRQGKFTLQMQLRNYFLDKGYKVGQFGTEPSSMLFGFDDEYPLGYMTDMCMNSEENIIKINSIMHEIDVRNNDLIIAGSQSNTVGVSFDNVVELPLYQQDFLLGTLPDACVLCINKLDEIEYINRTIKFIESICDTKIVALYTSPVEDVGYIGKYGNMNQMEKNTITDIDIPIIECNQISKIGELLIKYLS